MRRDSPPSLSRSSLNVEKAKERARKAELKGLWQEAIDVYEKILSELEGTSALDAELGLFNKIGDLYIKAGNVTAAMDTFERAVGHYAEAGLTNNAIALCNKILRTAPGRTPVYLKLAKLMVELGFISEAKQNLLEYAERMQKAGRLDEAFRALKEFADLSPDNEEIRLLLAEQLRAAARTDEARDQLARLYADVDATGDQRRSRATLQRIKAIDPDYDVETAPKPKPRLEKKPKSSELVFLDLDEEPVATKPAARAVPARGAPPAEEVKKAKRELEEAARTAGELVLEPTSLVEEEIAPPSAGLEIERTSFEEETKAAREEGLTVERTSSDFLALDEPIAALDGLDVQAPVAIPPQAAPAAPELEPTVIEEPLARPPARPKEPPKARTPAAAPPAELEELPLDVAELEPLETLDLDLDKEASVWDEAGVSAVELPEIELGEVEPEAPAEAARPGAPPKAAPPPVAPAPAGPPDVGTLESRVADDPDDAEAHRALAEALLEVGERERGLRELDIALDLKEGRSDWAGADDLVQEILLLDSNSIRHHQKRVELAFHQGDKGALAEAYLGLADALFRSGSTDRARVVYQRVLEHDPGNERARLSLETLEPAAAEPEKPAAVGAVGEQAPAKGDFIDLGALILGDAEELAMDTRMRVQDEEPTGDEQRDFDEMLSQFKRGIEANVAEEDWQAHYDLGVAFKEMGLLDEAISEFQKALRSPDGRLKTAEALGICFFEKGQHSVASTVLRRAVESESGADDAKIGLLYWLGRCEEQLGRVPDALTHYQRVFALDIRFQDVGERVQALSRPRS